MVMRILVSNDDGIDAPGLHALAEAVADLGDVVVVAPEDEYSGASAAIGAIFEQHPHVTRRDLGIDGIDAAWAVNGPPALCVMYARLGLFGDPFDLVVSGINPGANVGRSVYHSGTVGACVSGRTGGWSGIAVSQAVTGWGVEGQSYHELVAQQNWSTAATVARTFAEALLADLPTEPVVVNINVPNADLHDLAGWELTEVGLHPPRAISDAHLVPRAGEPDVFDVAIGYGDHIELPAHTDGGAIERNLVAVTYVSRYVHEQRDDLGRAEHALDDLISG